MFSFSIFIGLDKIEFLQSHNIRDIYQKAFCIIEQYFSNEEEEDLRVAPAANNNQYQFNADQSGRRLYYLFPKIKDRIF